MGGATSWQRWRLPSTQKSFVLPQGCEARYLHLYVSDMEMTKANHQTQAKVRWRGGDPLTLLSKECLLGQGRPGQELAPAPAHVPQI